MPKRHNNKDLLLELVRTNFKLRYNGSVLGFLWVLMKPFLNFLVLYVVFTAFRGGNAGPDYGTNLLLGIMLFSFVQEGVILGMKSLLDNAPIFLKINFPRKLAVTSSLFVALINLGINLLIFIGIAIVSHAVIHPLGIVYLFVIVALLTLLVYASTLFTSIILIRVRDLSNIMELLLQLLFWGSAVFYSFNDVQGKFGELLRLNPIAILIDAARGAVIRGELIHIPQFAIILVAGAIITVLGTIFFNKNIKLIAEYV